MAKQDKDFATGKPVNLLAPEEEIRQNYEKVLHYDLGYPKAAIEIEAPVQMGASAKRADIVVYNAAAAPRRIIGVVETKSPKRREGQAQLESYMSAIASCRWGVWTNGGEVEFAVKDRESGEINFDPTFAPPRYGEEDARIKTAGELRPAHNLKMIFRQINNMLYANTNLARSERQGAEMIRLIFSKMLDEDENKNGVPHFQVRYGESVAHMRERIDALWERARDGWLASDIFQSGERIELDDRSLAMVVRILQGYSLAKTDRDVVGDAFEIFAEKQFAGEKGQFFTPRPVVKMAVDMIDLAPGDKILDPACGSGGFLIYALSFAWEKLGGGASSQKKSGVANTCFFGIDKEIDLVKICKAHMCIMGDGRSNIVKADSLKAPDEWEPAARSVLLGARGERKVFDIILTNPPFGSKIKVLHQHVLENYDLGHAWKKTKDGWQKTDKTKPTPPQVLFIELCLSLLKAGGRLAIVLPDGILGNERDDYIRRWIQERADVLAVVDCPQATFMPHTGTKTSVVVLQKKTAARARSPIFFAISEKCGHTLRGKPILRADGEVDEDFSVITANYRRWDGVKDGGGSLGFYLAPAALRDNILVPRYYDPRIRREIDALRAQKGVALKTIAELEAGGALTVSGVGPYPSSEECSPYGEVRFIRTADIGCFELRENAKQRVDFPVYEKYKDAQDLRAGDILFVKDGDTRIGDMALLAEDDLQIVAQGHFYKIRARTLDPYLLLHLLGADIVKKQIRQRVFSQSTLSTIGGRIRDVMLPVPADERKRKGIARAVREHLTARRRALRALRSLC